MKNRQLDARCNRPGSASPLRDLATAVPIVIVRSRRCRHKIGEAAYQPGVIPADTYEGQTAASPTVAVQNFLVTHEGVPTDTVYNMTKSMFDNLDQMAPRTLPPRPSTRGRRPKSMPAAAAPGRREVLPRSRA
jgi:TRAP-type uncharacterized transport system substrate-binding protein